MTSSQKGAARGESRYSPSTLVAVITPRRPNCWTARSSSRRNGSPPTGLVEASPTSRSGWRADSSAAQSSYSALASTGERSGGREKPGSPKTVVLMPARSCWRKRPSRSSRRPPGVDLGPARRVHVRVAVHRVGGAEQPGHLPAHGVTPSAAARPASAGVRPRRAKTPGSVAQKSPRAHGPDGCGAGRSRSGVAHRQSCSGAELPGPAAQGLGPAVGSRALSGSAGRLKPWGRRRRVSRRRPFYETDLPIAYRWLIWELRRRARATQCVALALGRWPTGCLLG